MRASSLDRRAASFEAKIGVLAGFIDNIVWTGYCLEQSRDPLDGSLVAFWNADYCRTRVFRHTRNRLQAAPIVGLFCTAPQLLCQPVHGGGEGSGRRTAGSV